MDHRKIRRTGRQKHFPIQTLTSRNKLPRARGLEKKRQTCLKSIAGARAVSEQHFAKPLVQWTLIKHKHPSCSDSFMLGGFQRMCEECVTSCQVTLGDFTAMLACSVWGRVCEYHGVECIVVCNCTWRTTRQSLYWSHQKCKYRIAKKGNKHFIKKAKLIFQIAVHQSLQWYHQKETREAGVVLLLRIFNISCQLGGEAYRTLKSCLLNVGPTKIIHNICPSFFLFLFVLYVLNTAPICIHGTLYTYRCSVGYI